MFIIRTDCISMSESVSVLNRYGTTDLHVAAGVGNARQLEQLLNEGRDPNVQNNMNTGYKNILMQNGCVEILISHNSSPFVTDSLGHSPLDKISIALQKYEDNFNEILLTRYHRIHAYLKTHTFKPLTHLCRDRILGCLVSLDSSVIRSLSVPQQLHSFLQYSLPEDIQRDLFVSTFIKPFSPTPRKQAVAVQQQNSKCALM